MKTVYYLQIQYGSQQWKDIDGPFENEKEALEHCPNEKCFRIVMEKTPETDSEWLSFNDAWDAIGGDWQG